MIWLLGVPFGLATALAFSVVVLRNEVAQGYSTTKDDLGFVVFACVVGAAFSWGTFFLGLLAGGLWWLASKVIARWVPEPERKRSRGY